MRVASGSWGSTVARWRGFYRDPERNEAPKKCGAANGTFFYHNIANMV